MTTTARSMIQDAFEAIQVYAPGETATNPDMARGFATLNKMMDSWSNETLACYANLEGSVVLQPSKFQYTIGSSGGADIVQQRPLMINPSPGSCYVRDPNGNRYPMQVIEQEQWNMIGNIVATVGNYPQILFYDPQFPLGIINIWPVPNTNYTMFFDSRLQLTEFPNLSTSLVLPLGYEKAITENLAIDLAMYYPTAMVTPSLMRAAALSKGNVKRTNYKVPLAVYDPEIVARGKSTFDIYSYSDRGGMR